MGIKKRSDRAAKKHGEDGNRNNWEKSPQLQPWLPVREWSPKMHNKMSQMALAMSISLRKNKAQTPESQCMFSTKLSLWIGT